MIAGKIDIRWKELKCVLPVCVCVWKKRERGIQRGNKCVHEWARPLFQKIWPGPRTSWKHLCNSGLTNTMLSSQRKLRSVFVPKCNIKICIISNTQRFTCRCICMNMHECIGGTFHCYLSSDLNLAILKPQGQGCVTSQAEHIMLHCAGQI